METIPEKLDRLRRELRSYRITAAGIEELQSLARYIDRNDTELLDAIGPQDETGDDLPGHTPGPWSVTEDHAHYNVGYTDKDGDYWAIAWLEQGRACELDDANLIAAAPDMFAVLHDAAGRQHATASQFAEIDCTEETPCIYCYVIAKAKGK